MMMARQFRDHIGRRSGTARPLVGIVRVVIENRREGYGNDARMGMARPTD